MNRILLIFVIFSVSNGFSQNQLWLSANVGANSVLTRISDKNINGISFPIYPNGFNSSYRIKYLNKGKIGIETGFEIGAFGITYKFNDLYPDKYPGDNDKCICNVTRRVNNTKNFFQFLLSYNKENQKSIQTLGIGFSYLHTRYNLNTSGGGYNTEIDQINGDIISKHSVFTEGYSNIRFNNLFANIEYLYSYQLNTNIYLNLRFAYNQGFNKMFTILYNREYFESNTNYKENEHSEAFTRLSHFSINGGVIYILNIK